MKCYQSSLPPIPKLPRHFILGNPALPTNIFWRQVRRQFANNLIIYFYYLRYQPRSKFENIAWVKLYTVGLYLYNYTYFVHFHW